MKIELPKSAAKTETGPCEPEILHLSAADSRAVAGAMISAPEPNAKLREAFARHEEAVSVR